MQTPSQNVLAHTENQSRKKPYVQPKVIDLGSITELTQAVAGAPTDGGALGNEGSQL